MAAQTTNGATHTEFDVITRVKRVWYSHVLRWFPSCTRKEFLENYWEMQESAYMTNTRLPANFGNEMLSTEPWLLGWSKNILQYISTLGKKHCT